MRYAASRLRVSLVMMTLGLAAGCKRAPQEAPPAAPEAASAVHADSVIEYRNTALGFGVTLPRSWRGFSVRDSIWFGDSSGVTVAEGPKVVVVHPDATAEHPRQGIPILVFTTEQWNRLRADAWHIGAAPIGPSELGRNGQYVFALPARYNFAYLEGWEEVETMVREHSLFTFGPGTPQ